MENKTELIYKKPNFLIRTYSSASLQENKLLAVIIYGLKDAVKDENNRIVCRIPKSDIERAWNVSRSTMWECLSSAGERLTKITMGYKDDERQEFEFHNILDSVAYKDGVLTARFVPDLTPELEEIRKNYTWLSLPVMMGFESNYALRLYEILRAASYDISDKSKKEFYIESSVARLKFDLGIVSATENRVKSLLTKEHLTDEDYEKALSIAKNQKLREWRDFKKRALDPAVKEINDTPKARMKIEIIPIHGGRKITRVGFNVTLVDDIIGSEEDYSKLSLTDEEYGMIMLRTEISRSEAEAIAREAGYDISRINKAIDALESATIEVTNVVGFLKAAIRNNYEIPKKRKPSKNKKEFDFTSRTGIDDPDYEEMYFMQLGWSNSLSSEEFNEYIKIHKETQENLQDYINRKKGGEKA